MATEDDRHVTHGSDETRREFGAPIELREGESLDKIGHAHGTLRQYRDADDEGINVPDADRRRAQAGTLIEVAAAIADLRESADADIDSQLADLEIGARELAGCIADDCNADETAERLQEVQHG
jgi:hypothetical protein